MDFNLKAEKSCLSTPLEREDLYKENTKVIVHVFGYEVRAGGQQVVCLIPSTQVFLIVSAYFKLYTSAVEEGDL